MLAMIFMLWLISVIIELALVNKLPFLYTLLERFTLIAIAFSFGLSVLVGTVFGAHGLIVMIAGMGSTVTTMVLYKYHFLERIKSVHATTVQCFREIAEIVHAIWAFVTLPLRGYRWCKVRVNQLRTWRS